MKFLEFTTARATTCCLLFLCFFCVDQDLEAVHDPYLVEGDFCVNEYLRMFHSANERYERCLSTAGENQSTAASGCLRTFLTSSKESIFDVISNHMTFIRCTQNAYDAESEAKRTCKDNFIGELDDALDFVQRCWDNEDD